MRQSIHAGPPTSWAGELRSVLALASIAAGVIHVAVVPEHLEEDWVFGAFFIVVAVTQVAWAIVLVSRPSTLVYATGASVSGALIAIWAVSRMTGLPIGPEPWMPEPVQALDVVATLCEALVLVGSLVLMQRRRSRASAEPREPFTSTTHT